MKILIVTGLSGAGKTQVVKALEDIGYYCVDNMPPSLITKFAEIFHKSDEKKSKLAVVTDLRGGEMFNGLSMALDELSEYGIEYEILFLEASTETLIKRYKETRRTHPGANGGSIVDGINREIVLLSDIKSKSDFIVDTSNLSPTQVRDRIKLLFDENKEKGFVIDIISFGFKYGIPLDADLVFDVRFLPNPFYIPELKSKTGLETAVHDYVMNFDESKEFLIKLKDMISFLIPKYIKEGKTQLIIGIGCTGGHHRSVTLAEELYNTFHKSEYRTTVIHRDINRNI